MNDITMPKLVLLLFTIVIASVVAVPMPAQAHELQSDGPVHVIMHIDPKDTPVANEHSQLTFYVFDDQENFLGEHCDCNVKVTMDATILLSKPISVGDKGVNHVGTMPFNFPMTGNYQIDFSGKPTNGYTFHTFNLTYSQSVDQAKYVDPASAHDKPFFIGTAILGLAMAEFFFWAVREFKNE